MNWDALLDRSLSPPHKPAVKDDCDLANFRATEAEMPPDLP
jgi:hypothetical protein